MEPTGETLTVPYDLIPRGNNYVLRVKGDAMQAEAIADGDFLIVNQRSEADEGALVIVEVAGTEGRSVCRLRRDGNQTFVVKGAYCQLYRSEDVRVCGVVVGVIRKY
jgi:repressor LexA